MEFTKTLLIDAKSNNIKITSFYRFFYNFLFNPIWKFFVYLRISEYFNDKKKNSSLIIFKFFFNISRYLLRRYSIRLGFSIPINTLNPGVYIPHYGSLVINSNSKIGYNTCLHNNVVIGSNNGSLLAPQIGNNVFIGPGVKIFGNITIADGCYIGANCVVNKSIIEPNSVVVGIPQKTIRSEAIHWWQKNNWDLKIERNFN